MTTYTEQNVKYLIMQAIEAFQLKASILIFLAFFSGAIIGFILAYGIAYWNW